MEQHAQNIIQGQLHDMLTDASISMNCQPMPSQKTMSCESKLNLQQKTISVQMPLSNGTISADLTIGGTINVDNYKMPYDGKSMVSLHTQCNQGAALTDSKGCSITMKYTDGTSITQQGSKLKLYEEVFVSK
jgi:hypothetical protein